MIFKQRFGDGNTQFIDLGGDFVIRMRADPNFEDHYNRDYGKKQGDPVPADVFGMIEFKNSSDIYIYEPLYKDFNMWIYSCDGQLFKTLN